MAERSPVIEKILQILNYHFGSPNKFWFSILTLALFVAIILAAILASKWLRSLLDKRVLARVDIDAGLRYTLLRITHYVLVAAGLLYGLKIGFDIDLTGVAVILGFLSVGIGFGLQYIAADVVSGLILLFERPVRVGDRIRVGDIEGLVQTINIRTTIVVTTDNLSVIVPNSELVRNRFINYSYGSPLVRLPVPVGVAYESDIDVVISALLEAAATVDEVLKDRPPQVRLKGFSGSSIDLELLVWILEPHNHKQIISKVNFAILRSFSSYGIEMPFPQQEVRFRSGTKLDLNQAIESNRSGTGRQSGDASAGE